MTIAVHISAAKHQDLSENFNFFCFSQLAIQHPDSHFIFIFDSAPHPEIYLEKNCTPVILPPVIKNSLLRHYWYNYKLPAIIQRYSADVFITDRTSCSFKLTIPQCMAINGGQLITAEKYVYFKRFLPAFVQKAMHIFCLDEQAFDLINTKFAASTKASLLYPGSKIQINRLSNEKREAIREEFTKGNEYFYHITNNTNAEEIKIIIKAFSIFKKWQKSSMRMVLSISKKAEALLSEELRLYKYRGDVIIVTSETESDTLFSACYALFIKTTDLHEKIVAAMKLGVPVVIEEQLNKKKIFPSAVLTKWDDKTISEKMMLLYKDESLRNDCIERGLSDSVKYSWELTGKKIWEVLETK